MEITNKTGILLTYAHWGEPLHKSTIWYNSKILRQKWFIYTTDSKNSKNPENVESGWKSGSGIPEKNFFLKFFFFNCEQFLLNTFLSKMIINPKKVSFLPKKACFLHFSCTPHSSTDRRTDVVKFGYKIYKMAYSLTLHKSAHCFFPGKNRIRKIREKSGNEIFYFWDQILRLDSIIYCFI